MQFQNIYRGAVIPVDADEFVECQFYDCVLVYRGGPPPSFRECNFNKVQLIFENEAGNTVKFLQALASPSSGLMALVQQMFPELTAD